MEIGMKPASPIRVLLLIPLFYWSINFALAGKLNDFEDDVDVEKKQDDHSSKKRRCNNTDNRHDEEYNDSVSDVIIEHVPVIGRTRIEDFPTQPSFSQTQTRKPGDKITPIFRLDLGYGSIDDNIDFTDFRLELGFGALGAAFKSSRFSEDDDPEGLETTQALLLYRVTLTNNFEVDIGVGEYALKGNRHLADSAFNFSAIWSDSSGFGAEFRFVDTYGDSLNINDYEFSVLYSKDKYSLKTGYRWLEGETQSLTGPFAAFVYTF
jgi:hypothetical protein